MEQEVPENLLCEPGPVLSVLQTPDRADTSSFWLMLAPVSWLCPSLSGPSDIPLVA